MTVLMLYALLVELLDILLLKNSKTICFYQKFTINCALHVFKVWIYIPNCLYNKARGNLFVKKKMSIECVYLKILFDVCKKS